MMRVFNKRKQLKRRHLNIKPPSSAPCAVLSLTLALRLPMENTVALLSEFGWSAREAGDEPEHILELMGWRLVKLKPDERNSLRFFAPRRAFVHTPEHYLYVEDSVAYDTASSLDEPVDRFWLPPDGR